MWILVSGGAWALFFYGHRDMAIMILATEAFIAALRAEEAAKKANNNGDIR